MPRPATLPVFGGGVSHGRSISDGKKSPGSWHALQLVISPVQEFDACSRDEIDDRARDKNLMAPCEGHNSRCDMNGQSGQIVSPPFNLSRVNAHSYGEPDAAGSLFDNGGALKGAPWPIEICQGPISGRLDQAAAVPNQLAIHHLVVMIEDLPPASIALGNGVDGRADDVCEQHCRQDSVRRWASAHTGDELFDFIEQSVGVTREHQMILTSQLDKSRARDVVDEVAAV